MQFHPLADTFPLIEGQDLELLAEDIRANGQHEPIILKDGQILDGRNRYRACQMLGIEPAVREYDGPPGKELEFVISLNAHRRHLSTSQRAMVAARMVNVSHGGDRRTVQGANLHFEQAAKQLNVSVRSAKTARKILKKGAPLLVDAVIQGHFTVADAVTIVNHSHAYQCNIILKILTHNHNMATRQYRQWLKEQIRAHFAELLRADCEDSHSYHVDIIIAPGADFDHYRVLCYEALADGTFDGSAYLEGDIKRCMSTANVKERWGKVYADSKQATMTETAKFWSEMNEEERHKRIAERRGPGAPSGVACIGFYLRECWTEWKCGDFYGFVSVDTSTLTREQAVGGRL